MMQMVCASHQLLVPHVPLVGAAAAAAVAACSQAPHKAPTKPLLACGGHRLTFPAALAQVGWDVALTPEGLSLLEINISCNFFNGSYDRQRYVSLVFELLVQLEALEAARAAAGGGEAGSGQAGAGAGAAGAGAAGAGAAASSAPGGKGQKQR
jgi:hypothetical protein